MKCCLVADLVAVSQVEAKDYSTKGQEVEIQLENPCQPQVPQVQVGQPSNWCSSAQHCTK